MHIRFASPLAKILGTKECTVMVQESVTVEEMLAILAHQFSHAGFFRDRAKEDGFVPYVCMVLKNRKTLLNAGDRLHNGDELELLPPIMGG
jgi:molybdopterin converting factor small subunit